MANQIRLGRPLESEYFHRQCVTITIADHIHVCGWVYAMYTVKCLIFTGSGGSQPRAFLCPKCHFLRLVQVHYRKYVVQHVVSLL